MGAVSTVLVQCAAQCQPHVISPGGFLHIHTTAQFRRSLLPNTRPTQEAGTGVEKVKLHRFSQTAHLLVCVGMRGFVCSSAVRRARSGMCFCFCFCVCVWCCCCNCLRAGDGQAGWAAGRRGQPGSELEG